MTMLTTDHIHINQSWLFTHHMCASCWADLVETNYSLTYGQHIVHAYNRFSLIKNIYFQKSSHSLNTQKTDKKLFKMYTDISFRQLYSSLQVKINIFTLGFHVLIISIFDHLLTNQTVSFSLFRILFFKHDK